MTGLKHELFLYEGQKKLFVISPSSLHLCDILRTKAEPSVALACLSGGSREQVIFLWLSISGDQKMSFYLGL